MRTSSTSDGVGMVLRFVIFTIGIFWMLEFVNNCDSFDGTVGNALFAFTILIAIIAYKVYHTNCNSDAQ